MNRILVPISDFDLSLRALEFAGYIAKVFEAEVIAFHLIDPSKFRSKEDFKIEFFKFVEMQIKPKLKKAAAENPGLKKIKLETRPLEDPVAEHIVAFSEEIKADFILMGSHGQTGEEAWEDRFQKTIAYQVVLASEVPVFTFTSLPKTVSIKNILMPIDESEGSLIKVGLATQLAKGFGASISLFSIYTDDKQKIRLQKIHEQLKSKLNELGIGATGYFSEDNELSESLLSYAEDANADLIIIMNRPSNRWKELFITPGAKQIISTSKIPVLSLQAQDGETKW